MTAGDGNVVDAHCQVCHAARLQDRRHADGLIGRWMTVEASKAYARLHYGALIREVQERP